jgi:hypothetical protein
MVEIELGVESIEIPAVKPVADTPAEYRPVTSLILVEDALSRAPRVDKVIEALLWACEGRFEAAIYFSVEGERASAREGFGSAGPLSFADGFALPLGDHPLLRQSVEATQVAFEPSPAADDGGLCSRGEVAWGRPTAAVPFVIHGQVVGVLWATCGALPEREVLTDELERLGSLGTRALVRLGRAR